MRYLIVALLLSLLVPTAGAQTAGTSTDSGSSSAGTSTVSGPSSGNDDREEWQVMGTVPVLKFRRNEDPKLFDGAAGGIRWNPWYDRSDLWKDAFAGAVLMFSSVNGENLDTVDVDDRKIIYVMSAGLVFGVSWFQIGYGVDWLSSDEENPAYRDKQRQFFMFNLSGSYNF